MIFIDTNIAIALRDGDRSTRQRILTLGERPALSMITRIELEGGVSRGQDTVTRRALLDRILQTFMIEPIVEEDVLAYGRIVERLGYDRKRVLDRLIAAQAIVRSAALITRNGKDFRAIEGLQLVEWETPAGE